MTWESYVPRDVRLARARDQWWDINQEIRRLSDELDELYAEVDGLTKDLTDSDRDTPSEHRANFTGSQRKEKFRKVVATGAVIDAKVERCLALARWRDREVHRRLTEAEKLLRYAGIPVPW